MAKTKRLEARLTPAAFKLLQRAAALQGRTVSDFVVAASRQAAERTINEQNILHLAQGDQEQFAAAFLRPAPIPPALRRAARARRKLVGRH
ncbi:MAG: DUF1778 domain-containing protein [Planctomycetes bacterium]|nr:DUF1778 domain-containing protein [Planctomycetota bacterium]